MKNKIDSQRLREMANAVRALSMDAVQEANSGHPGMPLGMADVATLLFSKYLKFDSSCPSWIDRDRFVLSAGHGSMLLYAISYLTGYKDCTLNQIKNFRSLGSKTAGHPEYGLLSSVETTTGPLGQGLANAVGMAIAEKILNEKYNGLINHKTWVIVGDGCLMEGISHEAISIAGHLQLNKLVVLFDDNQISIDGPTNLTCSDDQLLRFKASNWNTIKVDGHNFKDIQKGIEFSLKSKKPTLISCKTIIGYGSPNKSGSESSHGAPLGHEEIKLTKERLNWPYKKFEVPPQILKKWRSVGKKDSSKRKKWEAKLKNSKFKNDLNKSYKPLNFIRNHETIRFLESAIQDSKPEATRKSSQKVIEYFTEVIPNFLGGSADLTGSNLTKTKLSFLKGKKLNYIHYGVREHLMAAAMNGISVHGGFIPYGGTFLVFSDYCKNSIRLAAMMNRQVIYVFTHDSIGLGEDGPTHQPIEHLAGLRSIPNLLVFRPCDFIETFEAWETALKNQNCPSAIVLSRQNLPPIRQDFKSNKTIKGAYFLEENNQSKFTIIASGSEVSVAVNIHKQLLKERIFSNVVSIPCIELFDKQSSKYKNKILGFKKRIIVEASSSFGWHKYLRADDLIFGIDKFGESGKAEDLFKYFGINESSILSKIKKYKIT